MKRVFLILIVCLIPISLAAQTTTSTDKFPGEPTNIRWPYAVADEPKISGFRIYYSIAQNGPFTNLSGSVGSSLRVFTFPAAFPSGAVKVFYVVRPYFNSGSGIVEAPDSNSVEVELRVGGITGVTVN